MGGDEALDEVGVPVSLPGVLFVYLCTLPAGFLVGAAVGQYERAVEDDEGKPQLSGFFQCFVQGGGLRGEDGDTLVLVAAGGGLRDAEALPEAGDVRLVAEPGEDELRLLVAAQGTGSR